MTTCPCQSGKAFAACCGPILEGTPAATAEALMRSRYTAFARGDFDHLERTHAPETRARFDRAAAARQQTAIQWLGLTVHKTAAGGPGDNHGIVEFTARYREAGKSGTLYERSRFRREQGRWVYVEGEIAAPEEPPKAAKVGRNAPCPCGSGRKYKKCCGG